METLLPPTELSNEELWNRYHRYFGTLVKRGMAHKAQQGDLPGCAPVGYLNKREGSRAYIVVDERMAPLVKESFALAAQGTLSLRKILAVMTEKGLRSRNGNPLGVAALCSILHNPFYVGKIRFKGELLPGNHTPIVTPGVFGSVQLRFADKLDTKGERGHYAADCE